VGHVRWSVLLCGLAACLLLSGCEGAPSILDARGQGAARIEGLWWLLFWIATGVFVVVLALLVVSVARARRAEDEIRKEVPRGELFIVLAGVVVPTLILTGVFVVSLRDMSSLADRGRQARMTIEVIGHNWWWEARYPNGAVTANEMHIPVGEPVRLKLMTADVIHSFWVPQLQAKTDLVTGRVNYMWLDADEPGRYRGQCAEFCGLQHTNMIFFVEADPAQDFEEWLENEAAPAAVPGGSAAEGEEIFMTTTCVGCHAVRGTEATAQVGPDLTHLAARKTIAAGLIPNTRDDLATWITDPQSVKPGTTMPPTELDADELDALLDYLQQLR
jgi:cytochrome c oxidase subunit II